MLIYLAMIDSTEDKEKFIRIYEQYKGLLFHVAIDILHSNEDAEDTVHQTFLYIIENLNKIELVNSAKTKSYLILICEHQAIDFLRKQKRRATQSFEDIENTHWETMPTYNEVSEVILKLKPVYREVLMLHYIHGYSEKEVAQLMKMKYNTIRKILQRAKIALTDLLIEEDR